MPTYEYECKKCGRTFTVSQTVGDHDRVMSSVGGDRTVFEKEESMHCPNCGSWEFEPHISSFYAKTSRKS